MRRLEFVVRRIAGAIFVLVGVSIITFSLARVVPSNAAALYIGPRARPEEIERVEEELGLNEPLPVQYGVYMRDLLQGDMGTSVSTKRPVTQELGDRLPATLELLFVGMTIAIVFGIPLGIISAYRQGRGSDILIRIVSIIGVSVPAFALGLLLQIVFFRSLDILPLSGRIASDMRFISPVEDITGFYLIDTVVTQNWIAAKDSLLHIILPAVALAAYPLALIARMTRSSMLEVLSQDYIRTARAYGLKERFIVYVYALKNAIGPTLTVIGLTFAFAITGTFFVEIIFNWPGLGLFTVRSLLNLDYPAIMGITLFGAFMYVIIHLVVDLLQAWVDPRISLQ
jgi:peptide/nickel transport system permease protein